MVVVSKMPDGRDQRGRTKGDRVLFEADGRDRSDRSDWLTTPVATRLMLQRQHRAHRSRAESPAGQDATQLFGTMPTTRHFERNDERSARRIGCSPNEGKSGG